MKLIQVLLILLVLLTIFVVRQRRTYLSRSFSRFGFLLTFILFFVGVMFPNLLQSAALFFGVGRGADLLLYLNVTATFIGTLIIFVKIKQIEAREALLVREIALQATIKSHKR